MVYVLGQAEDQIETVGGQNDEGKQGGINDKLPAPGSGLERLGKPIDG